MQRLKVAQALASTAVEIDVDVRGWIRTKRESKQGFAFLELNDGFNDISALKFAASKIQEAVSTGAPPSIICEIVQDLATMKATLGIEENRIGSALDGGLDIGIVEHDDRRLAAELEADLFEIALRRVENGAARRGRSGEGDLVDISVRRKCRPRLPAITGDKIDNPGREARRGHQLDEADGG